MLGEILSVDGMICGSPTDVCQSTSVLNVRAKTRSVVCDGSSWLINGTRTGLLFAWSDTRIVFERLKPKILIGVLEPSELTRESPVARTLASTPLTVR